ncbi:MAG: YihY/virulence factor BrkB family protein [Frankiaceae bacterium]
MKETLQQAQEKRPGGTAESPTQVPPAGWLQIVKRGWRQSKEHNTSLLAAGVAFFSFLSLIPALASLLILYGIFTNPNQAADQVKSWGKALPADAQKVLTDQLSGLAKTNGGALTIGLIITLAAALWAASGAMGNLIKALNVSYREGEGRGMVMQRGLALLLTFGGIVFFALTIALIAVIPALLNHFHLGIAGTALIQVARWGLLVVVVVVALAMLYRVGPDRQDPRFRWASVGALVATVLWVAGSVAFSFYVSTFGNYNKTYGALAGVVIMLLWLYLTCFAVLLGAEINSATELQTSEDTTTGEPLPKGERGATASDAYPEELPGTPEHDATRKHEAPSVAAPSDAGGPARRRSGASSH